MALMGHPYQQIRRAQAQTSRIRLLRMTGKNFKNKMIEHTNELV